MNEYDSQSVTDQRSQPKGVANIWLIGAFLASSRAARLGSLYEILFGLLIATLPFWLGGVVICVIGNLSELKSTGNWVAQFWIATKSTFNKGELLILAVSVIAPALWLSAHEPEGAKPLPHRRPIVAVTFIVVVICSVLYGLIQAGVVVNQTAVYNISCYFTVAAIVFMYLALTYHNFRLPTYQISETVILEVQTDFLDQVKRRRQGGTDE